MNRPQHTVPARPAPPAQVSARWLLTALGLLLVAAACCAYLTLCLLFLQGQWQLLYHPQEHARQAAQNVGPHTPASVGLTFTAVRFGIADTGAPELSGWWIPAGSASADAAAAQVRCTILYLHDGAGSLEDTVPALQRLHSLGCAVFAFDYRGYGASAAAHPGEAAMVADAGRAVAYLLETRHVAPGSLVLWGDGIGATIAAEVPGQAFPLVLEDVNLPARDLLRGDPRTHFLPIRLLLRDRLDAARAVGESYAPKLFLLPTGAAGDGTRRLYGHAKEPKALVAEDAEQDLRAYLRGVISAAH